MNKEYVDKAIEDFKQRITYEKDFCEYLYKEQTIRVLACKYAYYICNNPFISDAGYDIAERSWFIMGRALSYLKEDETSPCIDWDDKHLLAIEAIELANKLMRVKK